MNFYVLMSTLIVLGSKAANPSMWSKFVNFLSSILEGLNSVVHSYGIAVILFTVIMRLIILPLDLKSKKATMKMNEIQPKLEEINKKYKNDPDKRNRKTMELYQKNKINPLGGCLPLLIQMPLFFALFAALKQISDFHVQQKSIESFLWIRNIWVADSPFVDLYGKSIPLFSANWNGLFILPILAGITSYYQMKLSSPQSSSKQKDQMAGFSIIMPLMSVWFCSMYTASFAIYWVASNIFQIVQQLLYNKKYSVVKEGADSE